MELQKVENMTKDDVEVLRSRSEEDDSGCCGGFVAIFIQVISMILIICTFPLSLFVTVKMVQEYQRAVIFRLGRIKQGGAHGPGLFFIIPCMDTIQVDVLIFVTDCQSCS